MPKSVIDKAIKHIYFQSKFRAKIVGLWVCRWQIRELPLEALSTHINNMGVNSPLHFISSRFRNSNSLPLLKIYCLSRIQFCGEISLRLKYLHNFFLFNYQKHSICLSSLQSIPKFFKTFLFFEILQTQKKSFHQQPCLSWATKTMSGSEQLCTKLFMKTLWFLSNKKGQTRKRRIGQRFNTLWYPKSSLTSLPRCRTKRRVKIAVEPLSLQAGSFHLCR